jgi:hypothetical protein
MARLFAVAASFVVSGVACRQILGLDEMPPEIAAGGSGGEGDAGTEEGGGDAGDSPFQIVHAVPSSSAAEDLIAIWGASPDFVMAVGTSATSIVVSGGEITRLGGNEKGRDYLGVWGFAADDIYAVGQSQMGNAGFVNHFDGSGWTTVFEAPVPLLGVWGTIEQGKQVVLVTGLQGRLFGWHSQQVWSELEQLPAGPQDPDTPDAPVFWSISGRDAYDFSFASDGRFWRFEPEGQETVFAYYDFTTYSETRFRALWQAPDPPESVYIGTNFRGLMWFSAGTMTMLYRDESFATAAETFTQGVWGTPEKVITVGDHGWIFAYDLGTSTGAPVASPTDEALSSVWASSVDDVWIAGARELILHGSLK